MFLRSSHDLVFPLLLLQHQITCCLKSM